VQDTFTEFFVDGLNFFGGELFIGEEFLNVGDVLSISPEFFRDDIDFDIEKVNFNVGGHSFIEFEEEVDCAPQADGGDGESVFEALKREVDVGDEEDDFDGDKEDGFHDFRVLSFGGVKAAEVFSNKFVDREDLITFHFHGFGVLVLDSFFEHMINDLKNDLINLPCRKLLMQSRRQFIDIIVHHNSSSIRGLLNQGRNSAHRSLHDIFGELDVSGWDVGVGGLLDLGLEVLVVDDAVAHVTALVCVAVGEAYFFVWDV
jgi:hypothetical protein